MTLTDLIQPANPFAPPRQQTVRVEITNLSNCDAMFLREVVNLFTNPKAQCALARLRDGSASLRYHPVPGIAVVTDLHGEN